MYLISKLWYDPMENRNVYGYKPWRFAESEVEVAAFLSVNQKQFTKDDCWVFYEPKPLYSYEEIKEL